MTFPSRDTPDCLIPLNSDEALWEWHVPSDTLFLSRGARAALGLPAAEVPAGMAAFLAHIPPGCLSALHELREGVVNGPSSFLEATYPFDAVLVRERMMVLERDAEGRALRLAGQYVVSAAHTAYRPPLITDADAVAGDGPGYWHCSLAEGVISLDARCAALLGHADVRPLALTLEEWRQRLHPDEGGGIGRYQLVLEEPLMGDAIEDILRVRMEDGTYALRALRGAVLERDAAGRAVRLAGSLLDAEARAAPGMATPGNGRLLFAINASGDGLWDWDARTDTVYYSPRYLSMLGYTEEQFQGSLDVWKEKIHPDDYYKIVPPQRQIVESPRFGDTFECTYRLLRADGTWAWILGRGYVTHRDANGRATRLVGLHTDITATQNERDQLEDMAKNDALTGLRSRAFCDLEIARIEKNRVRPVSVIACDMNGLKLVNDFLGHAAGDTLLTRMALLLRHSLRATDCVARMGGDECVILLPGCPEAEARKILDDIRNHIEDSNKAGNEMPVLLSFGLAAAETPGVSLSRALMDADRRMLREKERDRRESHRRIKAWIERHAAVTVSLEDCRYDV